MYKEKMSVKYKTFLDKKNVQCNTDKIYHSEHKQKNNVLLLNGEHFLATYSLKKLCLKRQ
jgi:hypothetical protein